MISEFEQLPLFKWVTADTNRIDDILPVERYPTYVGNPDGSRNITAAWSGAAWDYIDQKMYISGGGHADSHLCENGVYELSADSLRFAVAMPRSPISAAQYWDEQRQAFVPGVIGNGGNAPLTDGSVPASHTYDSLVWIPPNVAGNRKGALLMFHESVGVINLDTRAYDTTHFTGITPVDLSYKICEMDGWNLLHTRANFYHRLWDMKPTTRTPTKWNASSRGAFVSQIPTKVNIVYGNKMMVRMPHRREFAVLSGAGVVRFRYGQALDSGNRTDWTMFHEIVPLTSADGSHLAFADPSNWLDDGQAKPFFAAGGTYDYWGNCIWVQTNAAGGPLYKVSGLENAGWVTQRVGVAAALTTTSNGTYHRCQVFTKGISRCLMRVSSTTGRPEVCRVA